MALHATGYEQGRDTLARVAPDLVLGFVAGAILKKGLSCKSWPPHITNNSGLVGSWFKLAPSCACGKKQDLSVDERSTLDVMIS